jgi:hypothetical protein
MRRIFGTIRVLLPSFFVPFVIFGKILLSSVPFVPPLPTQGYHQSREGKTFDERFL